MQHQTSSFDMAELEDDTLSDKAFEARTLRFSIVLLVAAICFVGAGVVLSLV